MMRLLAMLLVAMIVSGYYFPFTFSFLPGVNTKMVLVSSASAWFFMKDAGSAGLHSRKS